MPDPKDDRLFKSHEMANVFDPKVAQELFDEAMADNKEKSARIAELEKSWKEKSTSSGLSLILAMLLGISLILHAARDILPGFSPKPEGQEISNTTEKTVASDKPDIYSFEGAKKGRALTVEEAVEYSVNLPDDTRREIIKSWDKEKIVCADVSLKSEYEPKLRFFKLPDDLYTEIKYFECFSPKAASELIERVKHFKRHNNQEEERRIKIQKALDQLGSPKKEAPKPKPEPIEY